MRKRRPPRLPNGLLAVTVLLGVFLLLDIGLFAWLIFRSLSQKEIERVLLETRQEAEGLAGKIAGRAEAVGDLFTAVAVERETQTYIDSMLRQRELVETVEVRDRHGVLVARGRSQLVLPQREPAAPVPPDAPGRLPEIETKSFERQSTYEVSVPIADLGVLRLGLSAEEMGRRIGVLRADLLRQTGAVALATVVLLGLAYGLILRLIERGRRLQAQAAEAERLATLGALAAGLAHEIRNPLNSLSLNMQLLEEELSPQGSGGDQRRLLAITRSEIGRLDRLVSDFLAYARPRPLRREAWAAGGLLEEARALLAPEVSGRGGELTVEDASRGATVAVDPEQIAQLLLNLVQNAVHAADGTGRAPRVRLAAHLEGDEVRLDVADNGPGVAEADREKVFEIFYSTRKGGTGLGLAIARRIARAHGGDLTVGTGAEGGAVFAVHLPLAAGLPHQDGRATS